LQPGDLFVALIGAHFDGHDYLDVAAQRGACAALVSREQLHRLPQLVVDDTLQALGRLALLWREHARARVIAVTGSNGKTTLKEMIAAVLRHLGEVLATRGNLNNDIGLPLTLTRLQDEDYAVLELGANHAGEIDYLSRIARPDVAVLNNAGRAHLEGFGSLEGVARAKAEILHGLDPDGVFVYNADDRFAPLWRELAAGQATRSFGVQRPADVSSPPDAGELVWRDAGFGYRFPVRTPAGDVDLELRLAGGHNRMNALAATAASLSAGATLDAVAAGLAEIAPVRGRLCPLPGRDGMRLVDDSYNANPDSVAAAIAVLAAAPGRRNLVLGDLAELGGDAAALHAEIGRAARAAGLERLYTCGELSAAASAAFGSGARHCPAQAELVDVLAAELDAEDTVLVKGSRAAHMERVVEALSAETAPC
ncbi:MAG: UDP-N-acetylmuramoyl-tripeptide--D-alanyl-D-alanine ligase, partial [Pseudomonadota bacterium]